MYAMHIFITHLAPVKPQNCITIFISIISKQRGQRLKNWNADAVNAIILLFLTKWVGLKVNLDFGWLVTLRLILICRISSFKKNVILLLQTIHLS